MYTSPSREIERSSSYRGFELSRVNYIENDLKGNENCFELEGGSSYRKIPTISPGAYILQRPFLKGLFLEGLIFGGAYLQREICVSKSIGLVL